MHQTFRAGDVLLVAPCASDEIRPGDIIAFRRAVSAQDTTVVVHRVRRRGADGWITQGDGVAAPDAAPVSAAQLIGRVGFLERDGTVRRVWGGLAGRWWVRYLRLRDWAARWLGGPYRLLRASGLARRVWNPCLTQVRLVTDDGPLVKYVHCRRTVARWWPADGTFWCRKPYDLVIPHPSAGRCLGSGGEP
jgi:hypothetical protein